MSLRGEFLCLLGLGFSVDECVSSAFSFSVGDVSSLTG